jgi:HSP90 family molecular chaperone
MLFYLLICLSTWGLCDIIYRLSSFITYKIKIKEVKQEEELTLDELNPEDINRRNGCRTNIEDNKED